MIERRTLALAASLSSLVALAVTPSDASAATINTVRDGSSTETWSTASVWSNNAAPSAASGHVYELRHVARTASSFPDAQLTVVAGGVIGLKQATSTAKFIHMTAGSSIGNYYNDSATATLAGGLFADGPFSISSSDPDGRIDNISATITGDATITTSMGFDSNSFSTVRISGNNAATFTGDWITGGSGTGPTVGLTEFTTAGSFGSGGDLTINANSRVDFNYDYNGAATTDLVVNGILVLDQTLRVRTAQINGEYLQGGTYTFANLNGQFDANFQNGGTGTLIVTVPEPTTGAALLGGAGVALIARRRRR